MENLLAYLNKIPSGEITDTSELETLLAECWHQFSGDKGGMTPRKLFSRMEDVFWEYPMLNFVIERHRGTVMGSSRAEIQNWKVSMEQKTVSMHIEDYRQLEPRQVAIDVQPIADELASLIINGSKDKCIQWLGDGRVRVLSGVIFPTGSAAKQTLEGRKKRLVKAMEERLIPLGWQRKGSWWGRSIRDCSNHGATDKDVRSRR